MTDSPRVLCVGNMYPPHHLGGYEILWRSAVEHWRSCGYAVRVLASDYRHPSSSGEFELAEQSEDVHRELRWYWHDHEWPHLGPVETLRLERDNRRTLARHVDAFEPDVIAWWAMGGMSLSLLSQIGERRLPSLAVVCDGWLYYGPQHDRWISRWNEHPRVGRLARRLIGVPTALELRHVTEWAMISRYIADSVVAEHHDIGPMSIAPAGIDLGLFAERPPEPWRWRLLYVGRIEPQKGISTIIDALAKLPQEASLTVTAGADAGPHLAELREQARELGVSDRVLFTPFAAQDELADTYAAADVLVFSSTWPEPWGLVPLEAMAVGRPVIATGTGGSGEFLHDGRNCLIYQPGDAEQLAACVMQLHADAQLRESLRSEGLRTAAHYTEDRYVQQLTELLARSVEQV